MKYLLLLFLLLPSFLPAARKNHHIDLNVYVIDDGQKYPLYETKRMYKKFFSYLTEDDVIFKEYKDKFYDIKYIEVFIPNNMAQQTVVIGFRNKTKKTKVYEHPYNFFSFNVIDYSGKIFSSSFLRETRENLETVHVIEEYYAKILKVTF